MQLVVVDTSPPLRATLLGRVQEASRQAGLQRISVVDEDPLNLDAINWEKTIGCFIGPGCGSIIKELLSKIQVNRADCPLAIALDPDTYAREAVAVHKVLGRTVVCETDLAQMATFIVGCERQASGRPLGVRARHIVAVAELKGGVGATTLTAALGAAWARQGLTVAMVDFDDVGSQLSEWARVTAPQRMLTGELLRTGEVSSDKLRDFVCQIDGYDGRLAAIGTPLSYSEAFHLKSYVLDGAPSSAEFTDSLLSLLSTEYDIVLIDLGRSWGVSTFAALPWCERVIFVVDDDGLAVRRSLDTLSRLRQESGDAEEFNFSRWTVVLNRMTGSRLKPYDVVAALDSVEMFPKNPSVFPVSYSKNGRQWGEPGKSLYELAESSVRREIETLAGSIVPFSRGERVEKAKGAFAKLFGG